MKLVMDYMRLIKEEMFLKSVSLWMAVGKSAGVRTIIAFRTDKHAFFVYGYAKKCSLKYF